MTIYFKITYYQYRIIIIFWNNILKIICVYIYYPTIIIYKKKNFLYDILQIHDQRPVSAVRVQSGQKLRLWEILRI